MKNRCADFWDGIVDLAEGRENAAASAHVEGCADCRMKLEELREIFAVGDLKFYSAPKAVIDAAKGLMQPQRRVAGVFRSTLAFSGARTVAEDFQLVVGEGDTQTRLMFVHTGSGWEVLGRLPSGDWTV